MDAPNELAVLYPVGVGLEARAPQNNPKYQALVAYVESGEAGMKTKCPHCGSVSFIRSSKQLSKLVKEASCQCTNVVCGHTFIVAVEVVRTLSPSAFPDPLVAAQLKQSERWIGLQGAGNDNNSEHLTKDGAMT